MSIECYHRLPRAVWQSYKISSLVYETPTSPEPEDPKEGFQPLDLSYFEDEFFEDFKNTSKYSYQKRPPVPITPLEPLDKEPLRESIKELTATMSSEWVDGGERSSEEI